MELPKIVLRALVAYVVLLFLMRLSGKRAIAQGSAFDFVLALILGDLVDDLLWADVSVSQFMVASGVLVSSRLMGCLAGLISPLIARTAEGQPRAIMRNGSLLTSSVRRERMSERETEELFRLRGIERSEWRTVKGAWVEKNGRLSVLKRDWAREANRRDFERWRERR